MNQLSQAIRLSLIALLLPCLLGCHESGTWKDDARNWKRIFRSPRPDDVTVVHSWFWRSPHWSYEFEYFIQVAANDAFKKQLFSLNKLQQLVASEDVGAATRFSQNRPAWFAPKLPAMYEIWIYADEPHGEFKLFIDRETGDFFLTDIQL